MHTFVKIGKIQELGIWAQGTKTDYDVVIPVKRC